MSFSVLLRQKQVVRNLAIAVYLLNRLPFFVSFVPFVVNGLFGRGLIRTMELRVHSVYAGRASARRPAWLAVETRAGAWKAQIH